MPEDLTSPNSKIAAQMQEIVDPSQQSSTIHGTLVAGRYRLATVIGRGGIATVWRAHDERLGRDVAVKVTQQQPAHAPLTSGEALLSGALLHSNVVSIFDAGEMTPPNPPGTYVVMEYVDGTTALQIAPVPWQQAVEIARQAAEGLAALHEHGIVHCDVKPGNLLIDRRGRVMVADLGIATEVDGEIGEYVHGSPAYLAPERLRGDCASPSVDVYGLGGVLAYLITGQRPPDGPVTLPLGCPLPIVEVIRRSRAEHPDERYGDASAFRDAIVAAARRAEQGEDRLVGERVTTGARDHEPAGASRQVISHPTRARQPMLIQSAQETAAMVASPVRFIDTSLAATPVSSTRKWVTTLLAAGVIALLLILVVGFIVREVTSVESAVAGPAVTLVTRAAPG